MHRPVVDLVRRRLPVGLVVRAVHAAVDDRNCGAREPQPLMPGRVDLDELADRRLLLDQSQAVEAPLLERLRRPRQLHRPAQLGVDAADEVLDPAARRDGLFVLDAHQRILELARREPDVEHGAARQDDADGGEKQRHVLAEERTADLLPSGALPQPIERPAQPGTAAHEPTRRGGRLRRRIGWVDRVAHSITLSASARKRAGTVRPSAFAVVMLIASSNPASRRIGRSAGLLPFRIRPA